MKPFAKRVLAGLLLAGPFTAVPAHEYTGGFLGKPAQATDLHVVVCSNDGTGPAEHLSFQLNAGPPKTGPLVSAQLQVPSKKIAASVTDPINGDRQGSPGLQVRGGDTVYYITVDKTGPGIANYSFTYHCETASGGHTGTDLSTLQDQ
ncbi:hypothetical protein [Candidatus Methylocalor cossyra]|uniref:Uncharacterized protein n=1 Tax=Candidatus Methylocalor cossyra TaxID=3108543 RepID=A0ABM9NL42_9GAMM